MIHESKHRHITAQGSRKGRGEADITGGSAMGYKVMKYTLHSSGTSSHLSSSPQISQVTKPGTWHTLSHTSAPNHSTAVLHQEPAAMLSVFVCPRWSDNSPNLSCHLAPLTCHRRTTKWDKIPLLVLLRKKRRRRKKEKIFRKWKL